ncbi:MAG: gamma-glutamyl-gamma-aminobutyrate hydrolase family protein [Chloroflexota bacterium]
MRSPLIGITTKNYTDKEEVIDMAVTPTSYSNAVIQAGGMPVLIPINFPLEKLAELLAYLDGVLFTGGGDIEAEKFNGIAHKKNYGIDLQRDAIELQLAKEVTNRGTPFMGICRGLQLMNVAFGGSLYTHVGDHVENALEHRYYPGYAWDHIAHAVQVKEGSQFADIVGESLLQVNSLHHQGVKEIAASFQAVAHAPDGLIEAIEMPNYPFGIAVQWHPEHLLHDKCMLSIFDTFVQAAANG